MVVIEAINQLSTYEIRSCSHSEIKVLQVIFMCEFSFRGVLHHSAELVLIICPNDPVSGQCPQMRVSYQLYVRVPFP